MAGSRPAASAFPLDGFDASQSARRHPRHAARRISTEEPTGTAGGRGHGHRGRSPRPRSHAGRRAPGLGPGTLCPPARDFFAPSGARQRPLSRHQPDASLRCQDDARASPDNNDGRRCSTRSRPENRSSPWRISGRCPARRSMIATAAWRSSSTTWPAISRSCRQAASTPSCSATRATGPMC